MMIKKILHIILLSAFALMAKAQVTPVTIGGEYYDDAREAYILKVIEGKEIWVVDTGVLAYDRVEDIDVQGVRGIDVTEPTTDVFEVTFAAPVLLNNATFPTDTRYFRMTAGARDTLPENYAAFQPIEVTNYSALLDCYIVVEQDGTPISFYDECNNLITEYTIPPLETRKFIRQAASGGSWKIYPELPVDCSGGGGGDNIYTVDGTLTGNRVLTTGDNDLTFDMTGQTASASNTPFILKAKNESFSSNLLTFLNENNTSMGRLFLTNSSLQFRSDTLDWIILGDDRVTIQAGASAIRAVSDSTMLEPNWDAAPTATTFSDGAKYYNLTNHNTESWNVIGVSGEFELREAIHVPLQEFKFTEDITAGLGEYVWVVPPALDGKKIRSYYARVMAGTGEINVQLSVDGSSGCGLTIVNAAESNVSCVRTLSTGDIIRWNISVTTAGQTGFAGTLTVY